MDIIDDTVSMKDIDRLEALVKTTGGEVGYPMATGPASYGLLEDLERAQVVGHDGDYNG